MGESLSIADAQGPPVDAQLGLLFLLPLLLIIGAIVYLVRQHDKARVGNAPLRAEIEAAVSYSTPLDHVSFLGTGGFTGGTRGYWIIIKEPARLVVGVDAFMVTSYLDEYVFCGRKAPIAVSQEPSRMVKHDWIIISGRSGGRQAELAISREGALQEIWTALAGTGAAPVPRP